MACTSNQSSGLASLAHLDASPSSSTLLKGLSPYSLSTAARYELEKLGQSSPSNKNDYNQPIDILEELSLTNDLKRSLVDACHILKRLKNGNLFVYKEAITAIKELRRLAIDQFSSGKFSEALILAHQSLTLGRQYHSILDNVMLSSEMSTELYIISHCFIRAGKIDSGLPFLKELRYLVEMSIKGDGKLPKEKLPHLTYLLAKLYTAYNDQATSNFFFYKYIELVKSSGNKSNKTTDRTPNAEFSYEIEVSDALQRVCVEMVASRQYERALELSIEVLDTRIKIYGDFKTENSSVADAYCNVGLLHRLNGRPVDALHMLICGLDMRMRIYKNRNHPKVQNTLLSIACCYHVMGDLNSSYNIYGEVFTFRQLHLGANHPATRSVQKLLNECKGLLSTKDTIFPNNVTNNDPKVKAADSDGVRREFRNSGTVADKLKNILFKPSIDYSFTTPFKNYPVLPQINAFTPSYYSICSQYYEKYPPTNTIATVNVKLLPFINVPHLSCGQATLDGSGEPAMEISSEAEELLSSWGITGVKVSNTGEVTVPANNKIPNDVPMIVPYIDKGEIVLGFHKRALFLPNPAIAHLALLDTLSKDAKDVIKAPPPLPITPKAPLAKTPLVKTIPIKTIPIKTIPIKTIPIKTIPIKTIPIKTIPIETNPIKTPPILDTKGSYEKEIDENLTIPDTKISDKEVSDNNLSEGTSDNLTNAKSEGQDKQKLSVAKALFKKLTRTFSKGESSQSASAVDGDKNNSDNSESAKLQSEKNDKEGEIGENCENMLSLDEKLGSFTAKIGSLGNILKNVKAPQKAFIPKLVQRNPSHLTAVPTVSVTPANILRLKSFEDKIPLDIACKVYAISAVAPDHAVAAVGSGSYLLDKDLVPLVQVPWQIDLKMLKISTKVVKKTSLQEYEFTSADEKAREIYVKAMAGDGLRELGFGKPLTPFYQETLDFEILHIPETAIKKFAPKAESPSPSLGVTKVSAKKAMPAPKGKGKFGMKAPPKSMPPVGTKKTTAGIVKDTGKNRRFFWDPIFGDDAKGTMFEDMNFDQVQLEKSTVEDTFAKAPPKEKPVVAKQTIIQLLPNPKRSYNMNIALSKFSNYTFHELRQAIINLDTDILNAEATESLLTFLPTSEELSIMKEYVDSGGDLTRVDRPEQFVVAMIGIPLLFNRLDAHYVALCFREKYEEIMIPLHNLSEACDTVMNCQKLKAFSTAILKIGNAINEGDPKKGNATGFKATTFNKLLDFKTTTKPVRTLLRYIIDTIATYDEEIINIYPDMLVCEKAIRVDVPTIEGNISKLVASFNKIQSAVAEAKKLNDPLAEIMKEFVEQVEARVLALGDNFKEVIDHFKEMAGYLGYADNEVNKLTPEDLFTTLWNFVKNVENTRKARNDEIERQARKDAATQKKLKAQMQTESKAIPTKIKYNKAQPKILTNKLDDTLTQL